MLTSILAFQCDERGLAPLETRLSRLFPNLNLLTPDLSSIDGAELVSIENMLGQVSGLPREPVFGALVNMSNTAAAVSLNFTRMILLPNQRPSYSNLAFALVGRGLEKYLGASFEDSLVSNVFVPANMKSAGSYFTPEVVSAMASSFGPGGSVSKPGVVLGWAAPAGNVFASLRDLLRLGDATLTDNVLLGGYSRRKLVEGPFSLNSDALSGFGTPWEVQMIGNLPVRTKGGNVAGYSTLLIVIPEFNVSAAVVWNSQVDEGSIGRQILNIIIPQMQALTLKRQVFVNPVPPSSNFPTDMFGNYTTSLLPGVVFHFSENSGNIVTLSSNVQPTEQPLTFIGIFANQYFFAFPWDVSLPYDCQGQEETALNGETVIVAQANGKWTISLPNFEPGVFLTRN